MDNYYVTNMETQKLELHFEKSTYMGLTAEQKSDIKSAFLWGGNSGCWISRCKWPHTYYAEQVAKRLNLENKGKINERLSFAEQQEVKAEKAEHRAERYEARSERHAAEGERLQKPINDMHGDIAFFTQPNINSAGGRAFTRRRNRMFEAWERGFDEFKKSEYYADAAEIARQTARTATAPTSKGFCQRRIDDAEKTIRAQKRNLEEYNRRLAKIDAGEVIKHFDGEIITREEVENCIENTEELIEQAIEKSIYYREIIEDLGGIFTSKDINIADIVNVEHWGNVKVVSKGPKNFTGAFLEKHMTYADGSPHCLKFAYAEIKSVVKKSEPEEQQPKKIEHPFIKGEKLKVKLWDSNTREYVENTLEITNVTDTRVSYRINDGRSKSVKPYKSYSPEGNLYAIPVNGAYRDAVYKRME